MQEEWIDSFSGIIPADFYQVKVNAGDIDGLIISLFGLTHRVTIDFGRIYGITMWEEGTQMNDLLGCRMSESFMKRRSEKFTSVIYEIKDGALLNYTRQCMGDVLFDTYAPLQYNIITMNYIIEVVCMECPEITVAVDPV